MPKTYPRILRARREATERRNAGLTNIGSAFPTAMMTPVAAGVLVTPQTALTFSAVFSAISVLSTDVATPPLKVFRRKGANIDEEPTHPVARLAARTPTRDKRTTAMRNNQAKVGHVLSWGNGYSEIEYDNGGEPIGLHLLSPATTRPGTDERTGKFGYELSDKNKRLPPDRVLHIAGLGYDGVVGYSPVAMARQAIGLGIAAEQYGASFFGNGSTPKGVLKTKNKLSGEAQQRLRDRWEVMHQGSVNGNRVAVLAEGLEWEGITIPPEDAQFLSTRQFQVLEIARIYRLPPHKLGDYSQSHQTNIEAANLDYLMTSLMPWLQAIEQAWNLRLLTDEEFAAGYFIEHDVSRYLRADSAGRGELYSKALNDGWMNRDEVRRREGLNPIGPDRGGEKFLVPLNMTTLDKAGLATAPPNPPPAKRIQD